MRSPLRIGFHVIYDFLKTVSLHSVFPSQSYYLSSCISFLLVFEAVYVGKYCFLLEVRVFYECEGVIP